MGFKPLFVNWNKSKPRANGIFVGGSLSSAPHLLLYTPLFFLSLFIYLFFLIDIHLNFVSVFEYIHIYIKKVI
jgi:hypothetical protein